MTAAARRLDVEAVLYAVRVQIGSVRHNRFVLRRTVTAGPRPEDRVEQLWISPLLSVVHTRHTLAEILSKATASLMLAEPVDVGGSLKPPTASTLDELAGDLASSANTRLLVACRGPVQTDGSTRQLLAANLIGHPGLAGRRARSVMSAAIARLGARHRTATGAAGSDTTVSATVHLTVSDRESDTDDFANTSPTGRAAEPGGNTAVHRDHLTTATAAARDHLDQWDRIAAATLTTSPLPQEPAAQESPRWFELARESLVPQDAQAGRPTHVIATFIGVSGGIAGSGARQTNLFQYRLSPRIDLRRALRNNDVRDAFSRYASYTARRDADPDQCKTLRSAAVDSLRKALPGGETNWRPGEEPDEPEGEPTSTRVPTLEGTVILQDCRGVQVGNHVTQFNTFGYALTPHVRAGEVLAESPGVAESIVDYACSINGRTRGSVHHDLAEAVCGSAEAALLRKPGSGLHSAPATVHNDVGQIVGSGDQSDIVSVRTDPLRGVNNELRIVQNRISLAARKAEHARIKAEQERAQAEQVRIQAEQARLKFEQEQIQLQQQPANIHKLHTPSHSVPHTPSLSHYEGPSL